MTVNPARLQRLSEGVALLERVAADKAADPRAAMKALVAARLFARELEGQTGEAAEDLRERAAGVVATLEWALRRPDAARAFQIAI